MPQITSILKKGDKEESAEIIGIVSIENAKNFLISNGVGRMHEHPFLKDVTLDIKIIANHRGNGYFIKKKPVKIGKNMSFSTKRYSFTGTIINFVIK